MTKSVLILCTGNSCRSQMAEALWNDLGKGEWIAVSAGSKPAGYVHPLAMKALSEINVPLPSPRSKHLQEFLEMSFDLVVTVCDSAQESCPVFSGAKETLHWPFEDPAQATGNEEEQLTVFRRVRKKIQDKIGIYISNLD